MIKAIDHIGIAVTNLDEAVKLYRDILRLKFLGIEELPDRNLRVAVFDVNGVHIELLEPTSEDSAVGKFIQKRGEGMHHIAFTTGDIRHEMSELSEKGLQMIDSTPRSGAGGALVAFLHPSGTRRVLMELCERDAPDTIGKMNEK